MNHMELTLVSDGTYLHVKDGLFEAQLAGKKQRFSPNKIERILINSQMQVSSAVILLALQHNIDILFLDKYGDPAGRVWLPTFGSTSKIRRAQLELSTDARGLDWARSWVCQKLEARKKFLLELARRRPKHSENLKNTATSQKAGIQALQQLDLEQDDSAASMRGIEGSAGRKYFAALAAIQPPEFVFEGRSARPAKDLFNAMLNYGYGVLYGTVEKTVHLAGLDPHLGFLHRDGYNHRSFVFDFIEPYRIQIERTVVTLFSTKKVRANFADPLENGVTLNKQGKAVLMEALHQNLGQKVRHRGRLVQFKYSIQLEAHHVANQILEAR